MPPTRVPSPSTSAPAPLFGWLQSPAGLQVACAARARSRLHCDSPLRGWLVDSSDREACMLMPVQDFTWDSFIMLLVKTLLLVKRKSFVSHGKKTS